MSQGELRFAGWLAFAVVVAMIVGLVLRLLSPDEMPLEPTDVSLASLVQGMNLYLLWTFKRFLNVRHRFHHADRPILVMIALGLGMAVLSLPSLNWLEGKNIYEARYWVGIGALFFVGYGIVAIVLASRLGRLSSEPYRLLKWYRWTWRAAGICMVTIILFSLAFFPMLINSTILGVIFLRAAKESNETELAKPTLS